MRSVRFFAVEAWREFRDGFRGPLVPMVFLGLIAYLMLVLLNAEYLREMGATDVPRNSPHLIYLMTPGSGVWLLFAWAWVFAQVVTRDRGARLHEVVLSAPVSLRGLLVARYAGAVALACVLGAACPLGFLFVPALSAAGAIPAEAVGPAPIAAIAWAWVLFVVPSAFGVGGLYVSAAIKTRSSAGPFAAAAVLALVWMVAMVVLRGGDIDPTVATWMDPTGFAEVEEQTNRWTPSQKSTALLVLTAPMVVNRLFWSLVPILVLVAVLVRTRRDTLVLERDPSVLSGHREGTAEGTPGETAAAEGAAEPIGLPLGNTKRSWWSAVFLEARWHLAYSAGSWGLWLGVVLMALVGVAGSFVHVLAHAEGPFVPRAHVLVPVLTELAYITTVLMIAGFVGAMARRDRRTGFDELVDATPAPLGVRVVGRALAAGGLTVVLAQVPSFSAWVVMALAAPASFSFWDPVLYNAFIFSPALLELSALTLLVHAVLRSSGAAYALSMMLAFVAVLNYEIGVVSYPPAQVGIPVRVALSELTGWAPWVARVAAADALKVVLATLGVALAWLAWPRGTALSVRNRFGAWFVRARGQPGLLAVASVALVVVIAGVLHDRLVIRGGFVSESERDRRDAAWEARWWRQATAFSVAGGHVEVELRPAERSARVRWMLDNVRVDGSQLHGSLPHGLIIERAEVDGVAADFSVEHDHVAVELGGCALWGCAVQLHMRVVADGWSEAEPSWLHPSGIWARASDLLPRLGHDPERSLRAPAHRRDLGLPERPGDPDAAALVPSLAVAPRGDWQWNVRVARGEMLTASEGRTTEPLDFAVAWRPRPANRTERAGFVALSGAMRIETSAQILDDVAIMHRCVVERLGGSVRVATVLQAPRDLGDVALHGSVLWIPEDEGWDVGAAGAGRTRRRAAVAEALAARVLANRADLRAEPGSRWLIDGVAGWAALECIRRNEGAEAWSRYLAHRSDRTTEALGALEAPVSSVAMDGATSWVDAYAPLATLGWVETVGEPKARDVIDDVLLAVRHGQPLRDALERAAGTRVAAQLLGVPAASDVVVSVTTGERLRIEGARWRWKAGGWKAVPASDRFVQVFGSSSPGRRRRSPAPAIMDPPDESFTALDAWPSFERSVSDNVWRIGGVAK